MVYFITDGNNIKIGYSKNIERRLSELQVANSNKLTLLGYIQGDETDEKFLHNKFKSYKIRDNGEWFLASSELLDYINKNNEKKNIMIEWIDNKLYPCLSLKLE